MTKLILLGEAWGEHEERYSHAFVGPAGCELYRMLGEAGFPCEHLPYSFVSPIRMMGLWSTFPHRLMNVFNSRPPDPEHKNRAEYFYARLSDKAPIDRSLPARRFGSANGYVREEYAADVHRLREILLANRPNLIVALGATACWALGLPTTIGKIRGSIHDSPYGKVLPVYHPASILRNWSNRAITILDLYKALREMEFPSTRLTPREIWTEPSIQDLHTWWMTYGSKSSLLAFDIETERKTLISEVAFASDAHHAIHIPFLWKVQENGTKRWESYWSAKEEVEAWRFVKMVCESDVPKLGQNVLQYDTYWMAKEVGIVLKNVVHDTMTMAHCWNPELEKSLGFLGSIFMDERSWKQIRKEVGKEND